MRVILILLRVIAVAGILAPAAVSAQTEAAAEAPAVTLPAITVSAAEKRILRAVVLASGLIGAVEEVQVQPLIEGQPIESLEAEVGDLVAEGEVLAVLSASTLNLQKSQFAAALSSARASIAQAEAQVLEARSAAAEAERVNARTQTLQDQGASSQAAADTASANAVSAAARVTVAVQSLEAARAQLALAEAQLANVELQLQRTQVTAPVAGKIIERNAQVGSIATAAGQPMFVIVRDGELELRAEIAEGDLLRIKPGQAVSIRAVGADESLTGTVHLVEPQIDQTTRLGTARIKIGEPDLVRSGMFAEGEILVDEHEAIAVPVTAVGSSAEGATVTRITDGLAQRVPVKTGIRDGGYVEIVEGVAEGDLIVTKAGAFVRDGDRINPIPDTRPTN
jgi:HlyD family secretion protein